MAVDCIIVGAGLAGLTCGIRLAQQGLRTIIFSGGMNSLHFSSGCIDLLGHDAKGQMLESPWSTLNALPQTQPEHPYAKIGVGGIKQALTFFQTEMAKEELDFFANGEDNHFHFSALGVTKPTHLSQHSVFNERLQLAIVEKHPIAVLDFEGYRDCFASLMVSQLVKNPLFDQIEFQGGTVRLPAYAEKKKNLHEFRSVDLARVFNSETYLPRIAAQIRRAAGGAKVAILPAFVGIEKAKSIHQRLEQMTEMSIFEVPSLPPSILGMRIDRALRSRFCAYSGELSDGDRVVGGEFAGSLLDHVHTKNFGHTRHCADWYVLSTGSFFSNGLASRFDRMIEPLFDLQLDASQDRSEWYSPTIFNKNSHPYLSYGVTTDHQFRPRTRELEVISNLYCVGALLSGYNPVSEASGGGVAIASGYYVAEKIIEEHRQKSQA